MTPLINIEPSESSKPERESDPPFAVQLAVLMLCLVALAILTAPVWLP